MCGPQEVTNSHTPLQMFSYEMTVMSLENIHSLKLPLKGDVIIPDKGGGPSLAETKAISSALAKQQTQTDCDDGPIVKDLYIFKCKGTYALLIHNKFVL